MAKGENIFKRKDGRWEARYIKGYELSGKIKYGFCYGKTYREAKEKVTKCKAALVNGKPIPSTNSRHRFAFYCDEWLRMRKPKVKESTYIKYDTALRKHIKPKLGGCFPMGMTTGLIDDFNGKKEMRVLSREEQTCFVSYLLDDMDTCKFGVLLTLFTGVRIGELCALQWGNINTDVGCASGVIRSLEKDQVSGLCVCWGNIGAYLPQPLRAQTAKAPAEAAVVVDV